MYTSVTRIQSIVSGRILWFVSYLPLYVHSLPYCLLYTNMTAPIIAQQPILTIKHFCELCLPLIMCLYLFNVMQVPAVWAECDGRIKQHRYTGHHDTTWCWHCYNFTSTQPCQVCQDFWKQSYSGWLLAVHMTYLHTNGS